MCGTKTDLILCSEKMILMDKTPASNEVKENDI